MKVNLIKTKTVRIFAKNHASSIPSFEAWIEKIKNADWDKPNDMKHTFSSVDLLGNESNRVVFNIGGNNYRIICSYYFNKEIHTVTLFVKWIGTHATYDQICEQGRQYTIDKF